MNTVGEVSAAPPPVNTRSWWAYVPFGLLGSLSLMLGWMVHIAVSDPGFAVEADYYNKAVNWDRSRSQQAESDKLGWQVQVETNSGAETHQLIVHLKDNQGRPLSGAIIAVSAFHLARSANPLDLHQFDEQPGGVYTTDFAPDRSGLWELRIAATIAGETVRVIQRAELPAHTVTSAIGARHD
jgi:FixH